MKTKLTSLILLLTITALFILPGCGNPVGNYDGSELDDWIDDYRIYEVSDNVLYLEFGDEVDDIFKGSYVLQEALREINEDYTITGLSVCYSGNWLCYAYVIIETKQEVLNES